MAFRVSVGACRPSRSGRLVALAAGAILSIAVAAPAAAQTVPPVPGAGATGACFVAGVVVSGCVEGAAAGAVAGALPGAGTGRGGWKHDDGGFDYDRARR